ncbi:MAG: nuclear transport factor 2 family protein [Terracidiphilus sp.]
MIWKPSDLEARSAKAVSERGGKAFQGWFAPDGVLLGNGAVHVVGLVAIENSANWSPAAHQLTWTPTAPWWAPSGDIGYSESRSKDANGNPIPASGRYLTVWRKRAGGTRKIVQDASANEPLSAGDSRTLPRPASESGINLAPPFCKMGGRR